jgi:hypothetical protein
MAKIPYKEGKDFPELPTKTPLLCKIIESEFKTVDNPFYGKPTGKVDSDGEEIIDENETRDIVAVVFECVEGEYQGSRIWFNATASIHEKSKLRPLIEAAAFDHDPTKEELQDYDTDDLVGCKVYVSGEYGPKDTQHKFLRPSAFMRYKGKGKPAPAPVDDDEEEVKPARKASTRDKAVAATKVRAEKVEPRATKSDAVFDPNEIPF